MKAAAVKAVKQPSGMIPLATYRMALSEAIEMMGSGLEPTSALKQAASDYGVQYGEDMERFINWANKQMGF